MLKPSPSPNQLNNSKPSSSSPTVKHLQSHQVLVDVDAGIDDAWALFMLFRAHQNAEIDFEIKGITCVHGNTTVDNVITNVTRVLQTANMPPTEIPVYRGAQSALTIPFIEKGPPYNGEDGFGDANLQPIIPITEEEHAVNAIIRLAQEFRGTLTVLALGPLTNLALAILQKPEIKDYFQEIIILGGNIHSTGNVSPAAEFNFLADVEAARTVLDKFTCPMTIVPLETFEKSTSTYSFRVDVLGSLNTPQILLMNQVEAKHLEANKETWNAADALAAAVLIQPTVVTGSEAHYCTVELAGFFTRGMMVVDRNKYFQKPANLRIITSVNQELYEKILVTAAGGPYYQP